MPKKVRISLANKCQLLFGAAVVLILTAALTVVWSRMQSLVLEMQQSNARNMAQAWLGEMIQLSDAMRSFAEFNEQHWADQDLLLTLVGSEYFAAASAQDPFLAEAIGIFETGGDINEHTFFDQQKGHFLYARAVHRSDLARMQPSAGIPFNPAVDAPLIVNPLEMVLLIRDRSTTAKRQDTVNMIYIVAAGLLAGLLAIGAFWFITTHIILSPLRVLRETAEKVAEGDLNIRSEINTGDEFEQLSEIFNQMLGNLKSNQDKLRGINKSLDLKLGELAEANVVLFEANKIKGEFLANVSHELRTPLHSIIGFAEVLGETLADHTGPMDEKHKRYAANIVSSSRQLLDLINNLLDLAKIEAGRMELHIDPVSIEDTCEALINLIRPQAEKRNIQLDCTVASGIPLVHTDAGKLNQILGNFLSNAVKFTSDRGKVALEASLMPSADGDDTQRVSISVSDTGPGIPPEQQEAIFEKFHQLDATVTRQHTGTGLGLTISRELADLLQGEIELWSQPGRGATFSLTIPLVLEPKSVPLMPPLTDLPPRASSVGTTQRAS